MSYYFAMEDENGVLCVDQVESVIDDEISFSDLAAEYPNHIYFEYPTPVDPMDDLRTALVNRVHEDIALYHGGVRFWTRKAVEAFNQLVEPPETITEHLL